MGALRLTGRRFLIISAFPLSAVLAVLGLAACDSGQSATTPATATAQIGGNVTPEPVGKVIFARYCNSCHPGGGRGSGPSLITSNISRDAVKTRIRTGRGRMPAFNPDIISDADLESLADYVVSLRK